MEKIAVTIDFGTTYSSVAYKPVNNKKVNPTQLGNWPGQRGREFKVPSVVAYPKNETGGPTLWGFEADKSDNSLYWVVRLFKLLLDPANQVPQCVFPPGVSFKDVVQHYIQGLYDTLLNSLEDSTNKDLDFCLTIPVTFQDFVEDFEDIIKATDIGNRCVISMTEPAAASIHTICNTTLQSSSIDPRSCFIVCDAGGGTVDIASYSILQSSPTILLKTIGIPIGEFCGSTVIDYKFKNYIQSLMGESVWGSLGVSKRWLLVENFIRTKERFDNSSHYPVVNVVLNDIPCPGAIEGLLPISRGDMQGFFLESITKMKALLWTKIKECKNQGYSVKFIFLVGGLGSSIYVKEEIESRFSGGRAGIEVIQPKGAQYAVVLGANLSHVRTLRGGTGIIEAKVCRKNHGLIVQRPYNSDINFSYEKIIDPLSNQIFAKSQVKWLIFKGDAIMGESEQIFEEEFTWHVRACKGGRKCLNPSDCKGFWDRKEGWEVVLVNNGSSESPPHRVEPGVNITNKLVINLSGLEKSEFEELATERKGFLLRKSKYYRIKFKIRVYVRDIGVRAEMILKDSLRPDLMIVKRRG